MKTDLPVRAARLIVSLVVPCPKCGSDAACVGTAWIVDGRIQIPETTPGDGLVCRSCDEATRKAARAERRLRKKFARGLRLMKD